MVRPNNDFILTWASLSGSALAPGWQSIALPSAGPVEVRAGRRSPDNAEAVLLGFPTAELGTAEKLPEGQGFIVERADSGSEKQLRLALTHRAAGSIELFASMTCDVVGALDDAVAAGANEAKLLRVFIGRVGAWQEFMRKGSQALGPEAEIGLVGELVLLKRIIDAGMQPSVAIESWKGPLDGVQDFELGRGAMEVKATLAAAGFVAKIGSLAQLDDSIRQPLFLIGVRLQQAEAGQSLPELVLELRAAIKGDLEAEHLFEERLLAGGYYEAHVDRYIRRFTLGEVSVIEIDAQFPRMTLANVPTGVVRATYEIDLSKAIGSSVGLIDALQRLGAM